MAIGNMELMNECFPKHSRMGTEKNEILLKNTYIRFLSIKNEETRCLLFQFPEHAAVVPAGDRLPGAVLPPAGQSAHLLTGRRLPL